MVAQYYVLFSIPLSIWEGFNLAAQSGKSLGSLSFWYLFFSFIGIVAIVSGLLNEGIFFDFAVFGPLMLFCLGIFVLSFTVEARHGTSKIIDSYIFEKIGVTNLKTKETRIQLTLLMLIMGAFIFLISIYFLSLRKYSWFALFLSGSMVLFALTLGRKFGTVIGGSDNHYSQSKLQSEDLDSENSQLRKWLKTDWDSNLSKYQEKKIEEQKLRFLTKTKLILADPVISIDHIRKLGKVIEAQKGIDTYLFNSKEMKMVYSDWLIEAIASNESDSEVMDLLIALLLLPSIIELSEYVCRKSGRGLVTLFNNLLSLTGICISRLNCYDLIGGESNLSMISAMKNTEINTDLQGFIKLIGLYASQYKEYIQFSPWWLLNIRSRLQAAFASVHWKERVQPKQNQVYDSDVKEEFGEWCYLLSEMDTISDIYSADYSSTFSDLFSKLDKLGGLSIDNILQITWLTHFKLR